MTLRTGRWILLAAALVVTLLTGAAAILILQAQGLPKGRPIYVALGSSFASGPALGARAPGSPILCSRTVGSYPRRLARLLGLSLVDMTCGGATTRHLLSGGQFFQGAQIRAVTAETRLVTITAGGNDVGYVGDLSLLAARRTGGLFGWAVRSFWGGPRSLADRDVPGMERTLRATIRAVKARAPRGTVAVATYPAILPPSGTCPQLSLSPSEAAELRTVEHAFQAATRAAAAEGGAVLVDIGALGAAHHACSAEPWTRGWASLKDAPFHPTPAGAEATARAIASAVTAGTSPRSSAARGTRALPPAGRPAGSRE